MVAVALALVAALLTSYYVTNYQQNVRKDETNVPVCVATHDIPAGTSGADLTPEGSARRDGDRPPQRRARRDLESDAAREPRREAGDLRRRAGHDPPLLHPDGARGIQRPPDGTERAVSVPGDENQLLVGTLKANDRVDVVATWTFPEGSQTHYSRVILRDLLVLKAPTAGSAEDSLTASSDSHAAMLAISDRQVQKLYWALKNGEWHLQLRPAADAADSPENVESARSLLREGVAAKQLDETGVSFDSGGTTP